MTEPGSGRDGRDAPESRSTRISRASTPRIHRKAEQSRVPLSAISLARSRAACDARSAKRHLSASRCARSRRLKKPAPARPSGRARDARERRSVAFERARRVSRQPTTFAFHPSRRPSSPSPQTLTTADLTLPLVCVHPSGARRPVGRRGSLQGRHHVRAR